MTMRDSGALLWGALVFVRFTNFDAATLRQVVIVLATVVSRREYGRIWRCDILAYQQQSNHVAYF